MYMRIGSGIYVFFSFRVGKRGGGIRLTTLPRSLTIHVRYDRTICAQGIEFFYFQLPVLS